MSKLDKEVKVVRLEEIHPTKIVSGEMSTRLITNSRENSDRFSLALVSFEQGVIKEEGEVDKDNAAYIIEGALTLKFDNKEVELESGSAFYIPAGKIVKLWIKAPVKLLAIVSPPRI